VVVRVVGNGHDQRLPRANQVSAGTRPVKLDQKRVGPTHEVLPFLTPTVALARPRSRRRFGGLVIDHDVPGVHPGVQAHDGLEGCGCEV